MNLILYCIKRFMYRDLKTKFHTILCIIIHPSIIFQLLKIAKIKTSYTKSHYCFLKIKDLHFGHDVYLSNRSNVEKINNRLNAIKFLYDKNVKKFDLLVLRSILPSATDIQVYFDEIYKKYKVLNGNGRLYSFKSICDENIEIECEFFKK